MQEGERVMDTFKNHLHLPVTKIDDSKRMLSRLKVCPYPFPPYKHPRDRHSGLQSCTLPRRYGWTPDIKQVLDMLASSMAAPFGLEMFLSI